MSRFTRTTLLAIGAVAVAHAMLDGDPRTWVIVCIVAAYAVVFGCGVACIRMQFFCRAVCRADTGAMRVALTFDDGPDPDVTPALLDLLAREKIPAAFFCIGKNVAAHPQLAKRIAAEGHLLGNHTYRHAWWTNMLSSKGLTRELLQTQRAIQEAAGVTPGFMRPPVGLTNPHYTRALRNTNLTMVGWDVRSFDSVRDKRNVVNRIIRQAHDGSIIVLHDGGASAQQLLEIVSEVIRELRARGLGFERLDRMIGQAVPLMPVQAKLSA